MGSPVLEVMSKFPVSVLVGAACPEPAILGLLDVFPKDKLGVKPAFLRATAALAVLRIFLELFAANWTLVGVHLKAFFLGVQRLVVRTINLAFCTPKAA